MTSDDTPFPKIAHLADAAALRARFVELGWSIPADDRVLSAAEGSPLAQRLRWGSRELGNRWCVQPMEGWDATREGFPTPHTVRRWRRFGQSGAKLVWGGEAAAVVPNGRANPNQLLATSVHAAGLAELLGTLREAHRTAFGTDEDLAVGLQLTHSGRFCRPDVGPARPRLAYHHPLLDIKFGTSSAPDSTNSRSGALDNVMTDGELVELIDAYVSAAQTAEKVGFDFVDVKACHGYLMHELLGATARPGPFGGTWEGRTRLLREVITAIRQTAPGLGIGVRLSVFDSVPFTSRGGKGVPMSAPRAPEYCWGFGINPLRPAEPALDDAQRLVRELGEWGVTAVNVTAGSPYYNHHLQRPAAYPPSDGYPPPEDPLCGVARQIAATAEIKRRNPAMTIVGSAYSYLQEFLPHVAQAVVREDIVDAVGLGRMMLSYPELPADVLRHGHLLTRKRLCRTLSDCTTGPRAGLISGCYPLDDYYRALPEAERLRAFKREHRES